MEKEKIERINELARKSRAVGLTDEEKEEQKLLRQEYLTEIRVSFGATLENTVVKTPDGKTTDLKSYMKSRKK